MDHPDGPTETPRPVRRTPCRELRLWLVSLALAAPFLLPYISHFAASRFAAPPSGWLSTGFIRYDMPYYLANAREHFDNGRFRLFYSNPFDPRYGAPAIYVQPMSLALGATIHATGVDPGLLFVGFAVVAAWACARVALALYAEIIGLSGWAQRLGLVVFFWGGGLLALAGIGHSLMTRGVIEKEKAALSEMGQSSQAPSSAELPTGLRFGAEASAHRTPSLPGSSGRGPGRLGADDRRLATPAHGPENCRRDRPQARPTRNPPPAPGATARPSSEGLEELRPTVIRFRKMREKIFRFDPGDGWWFLNFGRNLVFPTESLYHALFFGCVLCLLRRRFLTAAVLAFLVSASHPFTGVELLLILASWSALELFFVRSTAVPRRFFIALVGLLGLHVGYYLVYLTRFPEHCKLMKAWTLAWELQAKNFVPAYALVGVLAFWSFRRLDLAQRFFAQPRNRLFLTWFLVAFTLANHEFAIRSIQPLHFTRGYIWTPLFFMGAMPLVDLFASLHRLDGPVLRTAAVGVVLVMLLLDNALWLGQFPLKALNGRPGGFAVTAAQLDLYRWLCRDENRGALLLTGDHDLGYLSSVYTPLRSWIGHRYNTPDIDKREGEIAAFLEEGCVVDAWWGKTLLVVVDRTTPGSHRLPKDRARPVYENEGYLVYRLELTGQVPHDPDQSSNDHARSALNAESSMVSWSLREPSLLETMVQFPQEGVLLSVALIRKVLRPYNKAWNSTSSHRVIGRSGGGSARCNSSKMVGSSEASRPPWASRRGRLVGGSPPRAGVAKRRCVPDLDSGPTPGPPHLKSQ